MKRAVRTVVAAMCIAGWAGGAARAQIAAGEVVAVRKAGYDLMDGLAAAMKNVLESGGDVGQFADSADAIQAWANVIPALFPPGSDQGDTKALPKIWSDRAGFEKAAATMGAAASKLTIAAKAGDKAAFAAAFKETDSACTACHRAYRAR